MVAGWLPACLAAWLPAWLSALLPGYLPGCLPGCLVACLQLPTTQHQTLCVFHTEQAGKVGPLVQGLVFTEVPMRTHFQFP